MQSVFGYLGSRTLLELVWRAYKGIIEAYYEPIWSLWIAARFVSLIGSTQKCLQTNRPIGPGPPSAPS